MIAARSVHVPAVLSQPPTFGDGSGRSRTSFTFASVSNAGAAVGRSRLAAATLVARRAARTADAVVEWVMDPAFPGGFDLPILPQAAGANAS